MPGETTIDYFGGKIPIDASTSPQMQIIPNDQVCTDLEETSDTLPNDGIFNGAYDDDEDVGILHQAVQTEGKIQKAFISPNKPCWVEAMQEELLQFKLQKVWVLVDLPYGKKPKVFRQEEGIDYDEVFAPVARIEAIRLFLAFASYMGFTVYQMDVKSAFLYGTIEEEVYVHQPLGFVDPAHPNKVYKVIKALYGLHQAPRAWYEILSSFLMEKGFRRVKQQHDGIYISQDKYVANILKKFDFLSIRTATTPIESNKPLVKDEDGVDVDVHVYRSMIGSLMYLTASRPDIMFAVCACARFQVTPKASHLNIQNQMMDYGFNFMNTNIHIDNESTISVIKNPVAHSRTKHIKIRFNFIRDCYEKRLIEVIKIHIDSNVVDLLTKGFDVTRTGRLEKEFKIPNRLKGMLLLTLVKMVKTPRSGLKRINPRRGVKQSKSTDNGRDIEESKSMAKNINTGLDAEDEINTGIEDVKGKEAQMVEEDIQATHKTKEQIRQEEAGLEEAIRLQAQMDEEICKTDSFR
ncbi:putative ribonuclease H-like domain-containing protein [Tanacetum coccineum]